MISTEEGEGAGGGDDEVRTSVGDITAGKSLSSNKRQLFASCAGSAGNLLGGVEVSLNGNGGTGMDEVRRIVLRGDVILRGVVRGHGFGMGLCIFEEGNLQDGTWGEELLLTTAVGGVRPVNLRGGVKPGVKAVFKGKTMDKEDILIWGHEEGEGGEEGGGEGGEEEESGDMCSLRGV